MRPRALMRGLPQTLLAFSLALCCGGAHASAAAQKPRARAKRGVASRPPATRAATDGTAPHASASLRAGAAARTLAVHTEPNAAVWLDGVRRGTTDAGGRLELKAVSAGRHSLRVRAKGFAERAVPLPPTQRGAVSVKLTRTTDEAELAFQEAEEAREKASTTEARQQAVELYRRALRLRANHPAARVGLARVLAEAGDYDGALKEIARARASRPAYAEASAVEGRIYRSLNDEAAAVESFRRAIREARGFQPEAYTGLGLAYEEQGNYEEAAAAFRQAAAQLSDTEPVLYELLGRTYERLEKYKEAVAAYEKYLELAPEGKLAPAIRSVIDQLRKQAAESNDE